jgi:hypothetical protein
MVKLANWSLAVLIALVLTATALADEPKGDQKSENKLVGTWKRISAKYDGMESKLPEGMTQLKHVTPQQFMWAVYDKDGKVEACLGGSYSLNKETYEEVPEYGIGEVLEQLKGKPQTFRWKVEGNKWYHDGKLSSGTTIEEVWERVERK